MRHQALYKLIAFSVLIKVGIEPAVNRETCHKILFKSLKIKALSALHQKGDGVHHHIPEVDFHLVAANGVASAGVNRFALIIHHIVIFKKALTYAEVVFLYLLLRSLDGA